MGESQFPTYENLLNEHVYGPAAGPFSWRARGQTGVPAPAFPMAYTGPFGATMVRTSEMQDPNVRYVPLQGSNVFSPQFNWLPVAYVVEKK